MTLAFDKVKTFTQLNLNIDFYQKIKDDTKKEFVIVDAIIFSCLMTPIVILIFNQLHILHIQYYLLLYFIVIALSFFIFKQVIKFNDLLYFKRKSNYELCKYYLQFNFGIIVDDLLKLNEPLIHNNNTTIKRKYEFLDFKSSNIKKLEFKNLEQYQLINKEIYNDETIKLILDKSESKKLSLQELQDYLKNYINIVETNNKKVNQILINNISNSPEGVQ